MSDLQFSIDVFGNHCNKCHHMFIVFIELQHFTFQEDDGIFMKTYMFSVVRPIDRTVSICKWYAFI